MIKGNETDPELMERADEVRTEALHEAYAKQNYECMMRKDMEGMMYWSDKIKELLRSSR